MEAVAILSAVIGLVVIGVLVFVTRSLFRTPRADRAEPEIGATTPTAWQALLVPPSTGLLGQMRRRRFGTLSIDDGFLRFLPDDGTDAWAVRATDLSARGRSSFSLIQGDLELDLGNAGTWIASVSDRPINRWVNNDFKRARQRRLADDFLRSLRLHGARVD